MRKRLKKKKKKKMAKREYFLDFEMYILNEVAKGCGMTIGQLLKPTPAYMYATGSNEGMQLISHSLHPVIESDGDAGGGE